MKGIDVSVHNGDIDWGKVKADGIDFAILRAGFGRLASQKDEKFEQNYAGAKAAGIPVGAYWYSYAMTPEEAELEADVFLSAIKGKQFEMPVYFDLEEKKQFDLGKEQVSAIMRAFLKKVENAGYFVGLYGSASSLTTHTADDIKSWYTIWLAHWVDQTNYSGAYGVWQHSEKGKVAGINGNVDLDICYKDFPTIIKGKGLNGWGKAEPTSTPAPDKPDTTVTATIKIGTDTYKGTLMKE
jgi:GH25 family lysozyme M1 (1,4-beta-N-acetylmuramidase)